MSVELRFPLKVRFYLVSSKRYEKARNKTNCDGTARYWYRLVPGTVRNYDSCWYKQFRFEKSKSKFFFSKRKDITGATGTTGTIGFDLQ